MLDHVNERVHVPLSVLHTNNDTSQRYNTEACRYRCCGWLIVLRTERAA